MERVKRPILLTGLILNIIVFGFLLVAGLVIASQVFYYSYIRYGEILFIGLLLLLILLIIFSGIGLSISSRQYEIFRRKSGFILITIIFTCILNIILILIIIYEDLFYILLLFIVLMSFIGTIFSIIGYVKGMQNYDNDYKIIQTPYQRIDPFEVALEKVEKLKKLREQNIISEEEYQILKQKQIDILRK